MRKRLLSALNCFARVSFLPKEDAMTTKIKIAAALVLGTIAVPAFAYWVQLPPSDLLADKLRSYGFYAINPPSTLVDVGSLYYVSEDGRQYTAICLAEPADVAGVELKSKSVQIQEDLSRNGSFATNISVSFRSFIKGSAANNYVERVHFSLTDIMLEEIPLASNLQISKKLMSKSECNAAVLPLLNSTGYVCQGQEILLATAEFKLDRDSQNKLTTGADITPEKVNEALKAAINDAERPKRRRAGWPAVLGVGAELWRRVLPDLSCAEWRSFCARFAEDSFGPVHQLCHLPHHRAVAARNARRASGRRARRPRRSEMTELPHNPCPPDPCDDDDHKDDKDHKPRPQTYYVCIRYNECQEDFMPVVFDDCCGSTTKPNRVCECATVELLEPPACLKEVQERCGCHEEHCHKMWEHFPETCPPSGQVCCIPLAIIRDYIYCEPLHERMIDNSIRPVLRSTEHLDRLIHCVIDKLPHLTAPYAHRAL